MRYPRKSTTPLVPVEGEVKASLSDQTRAEWDIFYQIDQLLEQKFGRSGGPRFVARMYDALVIKIFSHAIKTGTFRLPASLGTLRLCRRRPAYYQKATGKEGRRPPNIELRYVEGDSVKQALGRPVPRRASKPPRLVRETRRLAAEQVAGLVGVSVRDIRKFLKETE